MTRNEMIEQLQVQKCRVVFKKINGEERDMVCTLMETILPKACLLYTSPSPRD